ncbi:hypothetical protein Verru16b_00760 [Lacunisphaera limnophila]|uniref:Uncharacterized protein n=1 Tax=Lacunisphaera limnophila TaxID=1838286 RepID=A0A1D8AS55_9BACT|nr:hypothetical protein Verru16b_00760 [Lacunisphaera limnophila]
MRSASFADSLSANLGRFVERGATVPKLLQDVNQPFVIRSRRFRDASKQKNEK